MDLQDLLDQLVHKGQLALLVLQVCKVGRALKAQLVHKDLLVSLGR